MSDILRDPIWQFVGVILSFAALFFTFYFYKKQFSSKRLSYDIRTSTSVLSVRADMKGKLKVLFEGKEVSNVQLLIIRLLNSGDMSIVPSDFEQPVSLSFGDFAKVLTFEVTETSPSNLEALISLKDKLVILKPLLLNQRDWIDIKIVISGYPEVKVMGRLVGVNIIENLATKERRFNIVLVFINGFFIFLALIFLIVGYAIDNETLILLAYGLEILCTVGMVWFSVRLNQYYKRLHDAEA